MPGGRKTILDVGRAPLQPELSTRRMQRASFARWGGPGRSPRRFPWTRPAAGLGGTRTPHNRTYIDVSEYSGRPWRSIRSVTGSEINSLHCRGRRRNHRRRRSSGHAATIPGHLTEDGREQKEWPGGIGCPAAGLQAKNVNRNALGIAYASMIDRWVWPAKCPSLECATDLLASCGALDCDAGGRSRRQSSGPDRRRGWRPESGR